MRRLGSVVLASALLWVPRALGGRAFAAPRSAYVLVSPLAAGLLAFARALELALAGRPSWSLSARREGTVVIEVLNLASRRDADGRTLETIALAARDARGSRRLLLELRPEARPAAARRLLRRLSPSGC